MKAHVLRSFRSKPDHLAEMKVTPKHFLLPIVFVAQVDEAFVLILSLYHVPHVLIELSLCAYFFKSVSVFFPELQT